MRDALAVRRWSDDSRDARYVRTPDDHRADHVLVSALAEIGELYRARALCEKLLSLASPLGLYAEELDAVSGRNLGNFPQALTHLALSTP